jgi:putative addiction module component (TIGR02574 family)
MTEVAEKMKSTLALLSAQDRAELAYFLIHSLDEEEDPNWEAAWTAELARRAEEIKSGKAEGEPAEQVIAELRKKYS